MASRPGSAGVRSGTRARTSDPDAWFSDWSVDRPRRGDDRWRRSLQVVLGLIWLLDAALQFQPYMFGRSFVSDVLAGAESGNPQVVKTPMDWVVHLLWHGPASFNTLFALIQLTLAIGILYRPTAKLALAASVAWSMAVWWFGEGMGGIFSGLSPVAGYPGAVLLYALIALLVWPTGRVSTSVATSGPLGETTPKVLWLLLWGSFVPALLRSANRAPQGLNRALAGIASGEPQWEKSIDHALARALADHGTEVSITLAVLSAIVALAVFAPRLLPAALVVAAAVGLVFWVAQDFGGIFTSRGTDPNSGPLLILLAATYWPRPPKPTPAKAGAGPRTDFSVPG